MIDLMIPFADNKSAPYYEQIYCFIKREIQEGRIGAGEKLPSTRQLAEKLSVSRSTTQLAYDQLVAEGYLEARPCRGYYAAEVESLLAMPERGTEEMASAPEENRGKQDGNGLLDFSPRGIDLGHFPFSVWRKLSRETLQAGNREFFASGLPRGEQRLRQAICDYLQASRGIHCRPEQVVVGAGSEYLLMLLWQVTGKCRIAMENPTYRQASRVLQGLGHDIVPVAMDRSGMRADLLARSGADMAYIMPSHQFPTGAVMSVSRRREILNWSAEAPGRYLIEDDYDSEFRYRGRPIPALCGSDYTGRVIYLGTFSKAVAPAIRVSYMVLPEELNRRYDEVCGFYASTVSRVDQEILARFLEEGYFERHLNRMRGIYRNKHEALLEALEPLRKDFRISGEMAGLHLLLESRRGEREETLIARAAEAGVRVYGLSAYFLEPAESHTVILGYANLEEEEIRRGVQTLREAWKGKNPT